MRKFEDALDVSPLPNGSDWDVLEPFYYDTDVPCAGYSVPVRIVVPKGFVTDFASIPRFLWAIVGGPADGKYRLAAVIHDFLYRTHGLATRPQCDSVLLEAMQVCGVGWWTRTQIYSGVRVGGSRSYKGGL
jgi:hypothetical protein